MNNNEKIAKILSMNHDGEIIELNQENDHLNIKIKIRYLAKMINEEYTIMNYKLVGYSRLEFVNFKENNRKYDNIKEIAKMELIILNAKKNKSRICINVCTTNNEYGKIYLWTDDIIIYDQNNIEIEYNELYEICKKYWNNSK
jgi:hypothetical protein